MEYNNKIKITVFCALFFILFPPLYAGWQYCNDNNDAMLPHVFSDNALMKVQYDSRVFITSDSGENWRSITIELSSCYYGYSLNEKEEKDNLYNNTQISTNEDTEILSTTTGISSKLTNETINENSNFNYQQNIGNATVTSYLVKITKYIKYNISNTDGIESVKISHEKLTQGLYNLRVNGSGLVRTFNYYKLENDNSSIKKEWFS